MKKIAILGFGREGRSVLKFVRGRSAAAQFRGAEIWVLDRNTKIKIPRGVHARLGEKYLSGGGKTSGPALSDFDVVFRSPGVPYRTLEIQKALHDGAEISSATKLFFNEVRTLPRPPLVIGVTGTKGKGTVSTLLYNILRTAGKNVFLGGNIGTSPLELLPKLEGMTRPIVILELSSFQLQDLAASPDIAVVLDVFPDHQDAHKNLKEYYDAKANIARFQTAGQKVFFFKRSPMSARTAAAGRGTKIAVDENAKNFRRGFVPAELAMPGAHNFKNAVMAAAVAHALGVPENIIAREAKKFRGNEHRLEFVKMATGGRRGGTAGSRGVRFYNDSASTNPQTAAAALAAFPDDTKILIAGGKDKNLDYAPLAAALKRTRATTAGVILFGENKKKILAAIEKSGVPVALATDLDSALRLAFRSAKSLGKKAAAQKTIVLFSPGATSFDMFTDYAARGKKFKKLVQSL